MIKTILTFLISICIGVLSNICFATPLIYEIDPIDAYNEYVWQTQTNDSISYWAKIAAGNSGESTYYSPYRFMLRMGFIHVFIFGVFYWLWKKPDQRMRVFQYAQKIYHTKLVQYCIPYIKKGWIFLQKTFFEIKNSAYTKKICEFFAKQYQSFKNIARVQKIWKNVRFSYVSLKNKLFSQGK